MPQPLSKISPDAQFQLTTTALVDRPDLANLVTQIFALWAVVEQEFQTLFSRIVGPDEIVADAIYTILISESLQRTALNAAAKARFGTDSEEFEVFSAVLAVCNRAGKIRHKLAHWRWGESPDLPDVLLLADPADVRLVSLAGSYMRTIEPLDGEKRPERTARILKHITFDISKILVYRAKDLEDGLAEIGQAVQALTNFDLFINPSTTEERAEELKRLTGPQFEEAINVGTSAEALRRLSTLSLFQEARAQLSRGKSKNPRSPT